MKYPFAAVPPVQVQLLFSVKLDTGEYPAAAAAYLAAGSGKPPLQFGFDVSDWAKARPVLPANITNARITFIAVSPDSRRSIWRRCSRFNYT